MFKQYTNNILFFCAFCIIVSAILSLSWSDKEGFVVASENDSTNTFLIAKSLQYFDLLSQFCVFNNNTFLNSQDKLNIISFHPSPMSTYCTNNLHMTTNDERCSNIFINNISKNGEFGTCDNIESQTSIDKNDSLVRVLNGDYSLQKACFKLWCLSGSVLSGNRLVLVLDPKRMSDMADFVLLRPVAITIPNQGLYKIIHANNDNMLQDNVFTSYVNSDDSVIPARLYLQKVVRLPTDIISIYSDEKYNNVDILKPTTLIVTAYNLNFENIITETSVNTYNTFNNMSICIDPREKPRYTFTINTSKAPTNTNYKVCNKIQTTFTDDYNFVVNIDTNVSGGHAISQSINSLYKEKLNEWSNARKNSIQTNIIVTVTLDILVISGFIKNIETGELFICMSQTKMYDTNSIYLQYARSDIVRNSVDENNVKFISIPNIAQVSRRLGYGSGKTLY